MSIKDPAWRQTEPEDWDWHLETWENTPTDWTEVDPEEIDFPEPDDHDRRVSDLYDTANGDIGDEELPPY